MVTQQNFRRRTRSVLLAASLFALAGCVSVAPLEPIKNPPTIFRSDNSVDVEFLSPAIVGIRCAERGTAFYGMPVFHAMACGNGKLITMPDPCATFTGGAYAELACDARNQAKLLNETISPFLINASFTLSKTQARELSAANASGERAIKVEFVHPASVGQRCFLMGAPVVDGEEEGLRMCAGLDRIVLPNPCMQLEAGWYPRTLCHEMAHANGWAMDHPGGSFLSDKRAGVDPTAVPPSRLVMASLSSGAPLRKASESPIYLAYAAAREADSFQHSPLIQPAVFSDTAPAPKTDLRDLFAAFSLAQAAVPDLVSEARTRLTGLAAEFDVPALANLKLRPPSTGDLFAGARLIEASLAAPEPVSEAAVMQIASAPQTNALPAPETRRLSLRTDDTALISVHAEAGAAQPGDRAAPQADTALFFAGFSLDGSDMPAPVKLAAQQRALVLRRPSVLPAEVPQANVMVTAETAEAERAEPALPATPSFKPDVPALRRDETESFAAAGV